MTSSISSTLIGMQNATNQQKAAEQKKTGATQELGGDVFLKLMLEQLKYQDPLEPMDNTQFLEQQAQFTQVSSLQNIESSLTSFNSYSQAAAMIGRDVVIQDPNNAENFFYGTVDMVNFSGGTASVTIGDKEYPLSSVVQLHANPINTEQGNNGPTSDKEGDSSKQEQS